MEYHPISSLNNYCVTRRYKNGKEESTPKANDTYMQLFLSDQALNKSCYSCTYAKFPRQGDISVGDYWDVSTDQHPTWPVQHGISAVLAHTDKGKSALLEAQQKGKLELHPVSFHSMYRWQKHTYVSNRIRRDHKRKLLLTLLKSDATLSQCIERYGNYYCKGVICLNKNRLIFEALKAIKKTAKSVFRKFKR